MTESANSISVAPNRVIRGEGVFTVDRINELGANPLIVGGTQSSSLINQYIGNVPIALYTPDCSEASLNRLEQIVKKGKHDLIVGVGGGKALDSAKILAHKCLLPIVTVPTSGATCAAWTALSNIYTDEGGFLYDVTLNQSPDLLILDYKLIETAPKRTLVSGIGDALAKWYESSISSKDSTDSLTITAVQSARVLRDLLLQKSITALDNPGSSQWREVVDATVLLAGLIGGLGGARCRTVAAHAVHNGMTHLKGTNHTLHGEKVAYGILVQLRLEEIIQENRLALSSRMQLLKFYEKIGLPRSLEELGLKYITLRELRECAELICQKGSDIHRLPFSVYPEQIISAMISTMVDCKIESQN